jgi:hypothetical protein
VTFGITVNTYVCMSVMIVPGHTCNEYGAFVVGDLPVETRSGGQHENQWILRNAPGNIGVVGLIVSVVLLRGGRTQFEWWCSSAAMTS